MPSLKQQLHDTFQALVRERDQLRLEVSQAQEIITLLETEVNAIKFHGDAAFAKVAETREIVRHTFELVPEQSSACYWIKDLWLSDSSNAPLLGEAETAWNENTANPQKALNIVGKVLKGSIKQSERIKCNLFVAAVMLASGKTEEACAGANEMLHLCGNDLRYRHLAGIAHYLRGHVFLEIKSHRQAYWDFCLAAFTPGYHERVKLFQQYTENLIIQEEDPEQVSVPVATIHGPSSHRPVLKLAPEIQVPLDEFEFEKALNTPTSLRDDVQKDHVLDAKLSGLAPYSNIAP